MTNTRKMAMIAILSAISFLLMFFDFPILAAASFLKLDFSILPILLGLVLLDFGGAMSILFLRSLLKLLLNNQGVTTYIGLPMNMLAVAAFVLAFALLWKKKPTNLNYWLSGFLGTLLLTLAMVMANYFYAIPLYAQFANFDIEQFIGTGTYLWTMVAPFNLIQGLLFVLTFRIFYLLLKPIVKNYEK